MNTCCKVFPKLIREFKWMQFPENNKIFVAMPHFNIDTVMYRVNNCPSCGEEVRDVMFDKDDLIRLNLL